MVPLCGRYVKCVATLNETLIQFLVEVRKCKILWRNSKTFKSNNVYHDGFSKSAFMLNAVISVLCFKSRFIWCWIFLGVHFLIKAFNIYSDYSKSRQCWILALLPDAYTCIRSNFTPDICILKLRLWWIFNS